MEQMMLKKKQQPFNQLKALLYRCLENIDIILRSLKQLTLLILADIISVRIKHGNETKNSYEKNRKIYFGLSIFSTWNIYCLNFIF